MMLSLTPLSVFGADPNNGQIGGGSSTVDSGYSGPIPFDIGDGYGIRFSLYFAKGADENDLANGTAKFKQIGRTIDVRTSPSSRITLSTLLSVYDYMNGDHTTNIRKFDLTSASLVPKGDILDVNGNAVMEKKPLTDLAQTSWYNGTASFAVNYSKTDLNVYFMGVESYDKNNPGGDDSLDFTSTTAIANYIISLDSTYSQLGENDFRDGILTYTNGTKEHGVFKLFYEPFFGYTFNGSTKAITYRDSISYYLIYGGGLYDAQSATTKLLANRVYLADDEIFINMKGNTSGFQFSVNDKYQAMVDNTQSNYPNTPGYDSMGVGVVTGGIYGPGKNPPELVKTYVYIDSVDGSGKISYKKAAETTIKELSEVSDFLMDGDGNVSLTPDFDNVEYLEESGSRAYLNDIVAVDEDLVISSNSEWVNSLLPVNVEVDLKADSSDVAGYLTGIITNSDLYQNNVVKSGTASLNSFSDYYTEVSTNGTEID